MQKEKGCSISKKKNTARSTYQKVEIQWLNEPMWFVLSTVVVDCFLSQNRQLLLVSNSCEY